jgi:hypothetical protein
MTKSRTAHPVEVKRAAGGAAIGYDGGKKVI